ncbi:hypothetical protein ABQE91_03585, partial [Xanthomonas campestris pv. campestris]|uniref:hypothetical protein n=1 Tax=Xanthomonas campestris TaxID=339 RepID=UPI0032E43409
ALLHVRPLGFTDFIASAGTAQWGQVRCRLCGDANANADGYRLFGELIHKDNIESYLMLPEMFYFRL